MGLGGITNEGSHDDIDSDSGCRVEHTTGLDELVASVATASEEVEHGVYHGVKHTHAGSGDECSHEIDCESHSARGPLYEDTYDADYKCHEGCLLVAILLDKHTRGDTHHQVGAEVTIVADLGEEVARSELIFHNDCHR